MRTLSKHEIVFSNELEHDSFIKNIEQGKLTEERKQELEVVSDRFKKAVALHGMPKFINVEKKRRHG